MSVAHHTTVRRIQPGEDFPNDRKPQLPEILGPHKHAALAKRLYEASKQARAADAVLLAGNRRGVTPRGKTARNP